MRQLAGHASLRRSASFALVVALHAIVIGAGLRSQQRASFEPIDAPLSALMVDLAPLPMAPSVLPTEAPPGPLQHEQLLLEQEIEPQPMPKLEFLPELLPGAADQNEVSREKQRPVPHVRDIEESTAPRDVNALPYVQYAVRETTIGVHGKVLATWQASLLGHLEQYKRYPRQAIRRRQEGVVYVRFSVDRQGNVSNVRIDQRSEYSLLDQETLAVVQNASPVPPPPPEIEGNPVEVRVPVTFHLSKN